jgi:hypothetical protein
MGMRGLRPDVARWALRACVALALLLCAAPGARAQERSPPAPRYSESVLVERLVVELRAVDDGGAPLRDLRPEQLQARLDGRPARVESVRWIGALREPVAPDAPIVVIPDEERPPGGRLVVFLVQKDFERSRITGLVRMATLAERTLAAVPAEDRVAVLSFDTHLKLWLDFSSDRERVARLLGGLVGSRYPGLPAAAEPPSLVEHFDAEAGRRAATPERALEVLARALEPLPGLKSVVVVGFGLGRLVAGLGVVMTPDYERAREALARARASVFCLDVTDADAHSLEAGLMQVAEDTGGFYARTHLFPEQALDRLAGSLEGHYEVTLEVPEGVGDRRALKLRLVGRRGEILAPRWLE